MSWALVDGTAAQDFFYCFCSSAFFTAVQAILRVMGLQVVVVDAVMGRYLLLTAPPAADVLEIPQRLVLIMYDRILGRKDASFGYSTYHIFALPVVFKAVL